MVSATREAISTASLRTRQNCGVAIASLILGIIGSVTGIGALA
jgi:hypothetical protein